MNITGKKNKRNKMTVCLKFKTTDEEINQRIFTFDNSITVKEMLQSFLSQTNSKITLSPSDITFTFGAKILNKGDCVDKPLSKVFTSQKNTPIKVMDINNIIGG